MSKVELTMPKMGESIMEATILKWVKKAGDRVEEDETILEIATDKVDSEVPSPVSGVIAETLYEEGDTVEIGKAIAIIETEGQAPADSSAPAPEEEKETPAPATAAPNSNGRPAPTPQVATASAPAGHTPPSRFGESGRFYSPLVRNIAKTENISLEELEQIPGTGQHGRVTKKDILGYLQSRTSTGSAQRPSTGSAQRPSTSSVQRPSTGPTPSSQPSAIQQPTAKPAPGATPQPTGTLSADGRVEIIEMDRMRKLIADHMVRSKHTSPHVTSFVEVDVTNLVNWRNKHKDEFLKRYGTKITFTPIFIEAVVKAMHDYPMINISVEGDKILRKLDINIGMATALPSGNLIVPVIKNADMLSLPGLAKAVNDLAARARANKLKPKEIQGGTFTLTNVGTFGNVMGTPIINQPQVAILATGAIRKKPAVVETEYGDLIAIRQLMFLSLSYDHRVVDGALGGSFLRRIADYLEAFDSNRTL